MSTEQNVREIQGRIGEAAKRAGRDADEITLMAVSKTFPVERILEVYNAGLRVFGENRVQEFQGKAGLLRDLAGIDWHMIGHLQSNKAGRAAELFSAIDSVDSIRLAERLNAAAESLRKKLSVLIEVNVGCEAAKSGVAVGSEELEAILQKAVSWRHLVVRGLMTVPPYTENPEDARPYFRKLREVWEQITARNLPGVGMDVLSMGMSHDFEVAIEEGSTCVRVGTAIFGERGLG